MIDVENKKISNLTLLTDEIPVISITGGGWTIENNMIILGQTIRKPNRWERMLMWLRLWAKAPYVMVASQK